MSCSVDISDTHLTALFPGLPRWEVTRKAKPIWYVVCVPLKCPFLLGRRAPGLVHGSLGLRESTPETGFLLLFVARFTIVTSTHSDHTTPSVAIALIQRCAQYGDAGSHGVCTLQLCKWAHRSGDVIASQQSSCVDSRWCGTFDRMNIQNVVTSRFYNMLYECLHDAAGCTAAKHILSLGRNESADCKMALLSVCF